MRPVRGKRLGGIRRSGPASEETDGRIQRAVALFAGRRLAGPGEVGEDDDVAGVSGLPLEESTAGDHAQLGAPGRCRTPPCRGSRPSRRPSPGPRCRRRYGRPRAAPRSRSPGSPGRARRRRRGRVRVSRWPTTMAVPRSPGVGPSVYQPTSFGSSTGGVASSPSLGRARGPMTGASMPRDGMRKDVGRDRGSGRGGGVRVGGRRAGGRGRAARPARRRRPGRRPASGPPATSASGPAAACRPGRRPPRCPGRRARTARSTRRRPRTGPPPSPGRP